MELSRREVAIGAVVVGFGVVLGATMSGPGAVSGDVQYDGIPSEFISHVTALTAEGAIELAELGPRTLSSPRATLSGGSVTIDTPTEWPISSVSSFILTESDEGSFGFQAVSRGMGLYAYAPYFGLTLEGFVSLGGGVLAQYAVVDDTDGDLFLTLWQGPHHDLITSDYKSLDAAVAVLSGLSITDSEQGLVLSPRPARFNGYQVIEETLTVEFGPFLARLQSSAAGRAAPEWPGMPGRGGQFYRIHGDEAVGEGVLFVSSTATARLVEWESDERRNLVAETNIDPLIEGLAIDWQAI